MTRGLALAVLIVLASCAPAEISAPPPPAGHQPAEEAAVLAAADQYIAILSSNDLDDLAGLQLPEAMSFRASLGEDGVWTVVPRPMSYWTDPANDQALAYRERYWSPIVLIRGPIAVVWAPFEFWVNGETSHCGVNVMNFVKHDGQWKISNLTWTVEPNACEALRPSDQASLRPAQ